ncbi:MAG: glycosyltransferase family 4 protein [Desulfobacter sp.]|nr:MAG: glycosyltransferase family 4 protein [Desulfobacter sp.]
MKPDTIKVLTTIPYLKGKGGVTSYFNAILPYLTSAIPLEIGGLRKKGAFLHPLTDQFRFWNRMRHLNPNLVHINPSLGVKSFFRDGLLSWQAKRRGAKLLIFWHGWSNSFSEKVGEKYLSFFKHTFGKADGFIVLASEFEQKLRDWGVKVPIYIETTTVEDSLVNGIDIRQRWHQLKHDSVIKILFLSRLERTKGVFETIDAVKILLEKDIRVELTIAGDGPILEELRSHTRTIGLTPEQVKFTGFVRDDEKRRVFMQNHIYCFPTFYGEGLPISVLEAMSVGMPVLTRPMGGLSDMFEHGKMGALVHGKSAAEIALSLENILSSKDKMMEIGCYNAEYANRHFIAPVVAKRLNKIYSKI